MTARTWQALVAAVLVSVALLVSGCADEPFDKTANIAFSVHPQHKAIGRAAAKATIPAEITSLTVKLYQGETQIDATDLMAQSGNATFYAPSGTPLRLRSDAYNGAEHLFTGEADIAPLNVGETRPVTLALNSIIQIELAELKNPNPSPVSASTTHQFKIQATGLKNTAVDWFVNGVKGGSETLGTIDAEGVYTPPARAAIQTVVVRAVPVAAPSFAKEIPVELDIFINQAPTITLNGGASLVIAQNSVFEDPGATAVDAEDGDLTPALQITGQVDIGTLGDYPLTYRVTDQDGATTEVVRTIRVLLNPPTGVALLQASAGNGQVTLTWNAIANVSEYRIYRTSGASVDTNAAPLATVIVTSYTDHSVSNGTPYVYAIVAANSAGAGAASNQASARPLPPVPTAPGNLSATADDSQVTLTWAASTNSELYRIYRGTAANVSTTDPSLDVVAGTVTQYVDNHVLNGATYYYKVVATNLAGSGPESVEVRAQPWPPIPAAPGNLTATSGDNLVTLGWTASAHAEGYRLYRATASNVSPAGTPLAYVVPTQTQYLDNTAVNGTFYFYSVVAANVAGTSNASNEISVRPLPPLPSPASNLTATAGTNAVTLNWHVGAHASAYNLYRATSANVSTSGAPLAVVGNTVVQYTDATAANGPTYFYTVVATNLAGASAAANEVNARPLPPLPAAPTILSATADDGQVTLSWAAVSGASEYRVYRGTAPNVATTGAPAATVTTTGVVDNVLTNGATYYYKVVAANLAGPGPVSSEVSAKVGRLIVLSSFTDAALRACVQGTGKLYVHEVTFLYCPRAGISSVVGIEQLTMLQALSFPSNEIDPRYVDLGSNQIGDLSPLAALTALTSLNLEGNSIVDVSPLMHLTALTTLDLSSNQIADVSPLGGLTALTSLSLSGAQLVDVSPLAGLTALTSLSLTRTQLVDVAPLARLTALTQLDLSTIRLTNVTPLAGLTALTSLSLWGNRIVDVAPLARLTALTSLSLGYNQLADISPLAGLTALTWLDLSHNQLVVVSPLAHLTALTHLDLLENQIVDGSPLAHLSALTSLDLGGNSIVDVSPLAHLTALTSLGLEGNSIVDVSPLAHLTALTSLNLRYNYSLSCASVNSLDAQFDRSDGKSAGIVSWTSCDNAAFLLTDITNSSNVQRALPWNGVLAVRTHRFVLSQLNVSQQYAITLTNLRNDVDLRIYDDASFSNRVCSSAAGGTTAESCVVYPNPGGSLYVDVYDYSNTQASYTLGVHVVVP